MALAEKVLRKINKLGLIPKARRLLPRISLVLALFSILWLITLPQDGNYRNCYISENALMPAQVNSYFRESEWNIVRGYREEIHKLEEKPIDERNEIIKHWLLDLGLQVSSHKNGVSNDTLYAIMHASRGENTEAMALVVPWINSDNEYNEGAMALGMALLRYFQRISVWSKNIILVIPPDGKQSLRSWVNAYHTTLDDTAGSIEAAIVIEYGKQGDNFEYYDMFYEGLNGQLPNLDLLNTANLISSHEGMSCHMQGISDRAINFQNRLKTLFKGILKLALAGTNDVHGHEAFSGWQIQAFTIKAQGTKGPDVTQFGRIVDSTFRSVNNLLEKFHQSFFFYLMLSPKHFVSIGTYLPSAVMLAVSYALSGLSVVLNSGIDLSEIPQNITSLLTIATMIELFCLVLAIVIPLLPIDTIRLVPTIAQGFFILSITGGKQRLTRTASYSLIAFALLIIALLITALLIVHFAIAFTIGLLALPLTFVPILIERDRKLAIICLSISNPFSIILIAGVFPEFNDLFAQLILAWTQLQSWTWLVVILGWFSSWLMIAYGASGIRSNIDLKKVSPVLKEKSLEKSSIPKE
ncbi:GAA1 [Candida pseudojiufengensis]|uniref:GAA1 n=1 Tax=Candida pseudojiufengensis TaxID=497109 RepID=UPI002224FE99|nr:GAA1 [Candida pseudojiufengensis]KAI5964227.1 GAA1 [Candida pseudojiufengensis]